MARRKKRSKLIKLKAEIISMIVLGLILLLMGLVGMNSTPEQRESAGELRSWSIGTSGNSYGKRPSTRNTWFEVNIGGRILKINYIPYLPLNMGTPYYAD